MQWILIYFFGFKRIFFIFTIDKRHQTNRWADDGPTKCYSREIMNKAELLARFNRHPSMCVCAWVSTCVYTAQCTMFVYTWAPYTLWFITSISRKHVCALSMYIQNTGEKHRHIHSYNAQKFQKYDYSHYIRPHCKPQQFIVFSWIIANEILIWNS